MTSRRKEQDVYSLVDRVQDAARQRLWMDSWLNDRTFLKSDGKLIYSIDVDIIKLYLTPFELSRPLRGRKGYSRIFRNDPDHVSVALGKAIADFIFFDSVNVTPRLVLPPLEHEIADIYGALVMSADTEHTEARKELVAGLDKLLGQLKGETNKSKRVDMLVTNLPAVTKYLFSDKGPSAQLQRLGDLVEHSSLLPLDQFILRYQEITPLREILNSPRSVRDWILFTERKNEWKRRLSKKKIGRKETIIDNDASVLSRLEFLNHLLERMNYRIVHITGDQALFDVAQSYRPTNSRLSFAEKYLRHPRAFLGESSVLFATPISAGKHSSQQLTEWLDVFLADFTDSKSLGRDKLRLILSQNRKTLAKHARAALSRNPDALALFQNRWNEFTGPLTLAHGRGLNVDNTSNSAHSLHPLVTDLDSLLQKLSDLVEQRVRMTWERCFAAATSVGLSLVQAEARPKRNLPPIAFDRFHRVRTIVEKQISENARHYVANRINQKEVERLWDDDKTGYLYYLVFGLFFAAENKWRVVSILADRCINIARNEARKKDSIISGREAFYLLAIAQRLLSATSSDLDTAAKYICEAIEALEKDRKGFPQLTITPLRFEAEFIALAVARHMINRFVEHPFPDKQDSRLIPFDRLIQTIAELLHRLNEERDTRIKETIRRALLVNLFSILALSVDSDVAFDLHVFEKDYSAFKDSLNEERTSIAVSYLHQSVFLAARSLFEKPASRTERRSWRSEIVGHFSDPSISNATITVYDAKRFEFLRDLSLAQLDRPH